MTLSINAIAATKHCSKCPPDAAPKPLAAFHKDAKRSDGRRAVCKDCTARYGAARNARIREAARAYEAQQRAYSTAGMPPATLADHRVPYRDDVAAAMDRQPAPVGRYVLLALVVVALAGYLLGVYAGR